MRKQTHLRLHRQRGQALVETALMMWVIITVVFFVFELGWLMYTYSVLADAANEGVRYAIVHSGGDNRVRVSVTYTYIPALPQFITAPTMHSFAEGRMVAQ